MESFQEINLKSYRNKGIDDNATVDEKYCYLKLQEMYLDYKCGKIDKEKAIKIRNKIEKEYENNKKNHEEYLRICKEYNDYRIKFETDLYKLNKTNDEHEKLKIALNIISKITNNKIDFSQN